MQQPQHQRFDRRVIARGESSNHTPMDVARPRFRLPSSHFRTIELSIAATYAYTTLAQRTLADALQSHLHMDPSWTQLGAALGFKRAWRRTDGQHVDYRLSGLVRAPLRAIMRVVHVTTEHDNEALCTRRRVLFGNHVDAQTLAIVQDESRSSSNSESSKNSKTKSTTHCALRWEAMTTSTTIVDHCVLEYTGTTTHEDTALGFYILESIDRPECVSLVDSHGITRQRTRQVLLLRPHRTVPDCTELVLVGTSVPTVSRLASLLDKLAIQFSRLPAVLQAQRLSALPRLDRSQWVQSKDRRYCSVCLSKFALWDRKRHCHTCGDVVCKTCRLVIEPFDDTTATWLKVCKQCVLSFDDKTQRKSDEAEDDVLATTQDTQSSSTLSRTATTVVVAAWPVVEGQPVVATHNDDDDVVARRRHGTIHDDPLLRAVRVSTEDVIIGELISRGAFGEVFKGLFRDQVVAIKRILPDRRRDVEEIYAFLDEIKLVASLRHDRIVRLVGVTWESLSELSMLLEYVDGGDLRTVLRRFALEDDDQQDPRGFTATKRRIACHMAQALAYLHALDPIVLHRDLKSTNVLLTETLDAKLTDFGIARESDCAVTMTGGVGTLLWMAPEVMMGERYDAKADVFSLGVVLSELETQALPYADVRERRGRRHAMGRLPETALLQGIISGTVTVSLTTNASDELADLVHACVAVRPHDRPTAAQVLEVLEHMATTKERPNALSSRC